MYAMLLPIVTWGQGTKEKPEWANPSFYMDLAQSYLETVVVTGNSYEEVREKAAEVIKQRRNITTGVSFVASSEDNEGIFASKSLAEYWENDGWYKGYFLMQTLKNPKNKYDNIRITSEYGFSPRALVPGLAQIHKGSTLKGGLFIAAEVAFVGGIIVTESLRASYESKVSTTHNASDRQTYIDNADNMSNVRNVMIGGTVAVYAWSLIDGIAAKGKTQIILGSTKLRFAPYATSQSSGMVLVLNF
jgi:hypothetical protein